MSKQHHIQTEAAAKCCHVCTKGTQKGATKGDKGTNRANTNTTTNHDSTSARIVPMQTWQKDDYYPTYRSSYVGRLLP